MKCPPLSEEATVNSQTVWNTWYGTAKPVYDFSTKACIADCCSISIAPPSPRWGYTFWLFLISQLEKYIPSVPPLYYKKLIYRISQTKQYLLIIANF